MRFLRREDLHTSHFKKDILQLLIFQEEERYLIPLTVKVCRSVLLSFRLIIEICLQATFVIDNFRLIAFIIFDKIALHSIINSPLQHHAFTRLFIHLNICDRTHLPAFFARSASETHEIFMGPTLSNAICVSSRFRRTFYYDSVRLLRVN